MKRNVYGALAMLAVALMVIMPLAQAQSRVKANVPFAFSMSERSLPAGNYQIISLSDAVLEVWNSDAQHGQLLPRQMWVKSNRIEHAKLVFHKYGDQYFLSEIWDGQSDTGVQLSESKREKETKIAGNSNTLETVVVAMK